MDLIQKESSLCEEEEEEEEEEDSINETTKKCCTICKTTKTPLWRVGPSGPKSLCNACGIRYKKKGTVIGLKKISEKKQKKTSFGGTIASSNSTITNTSASRNENGLSESMKMELMALGKEVVLLQRQRSVRRQQRRGRRRRRKMGEEEQAAVLLMALSCGSVFA